MTREEFEATANLQVFSSAAIASRWHNVKDACTPADSPVEVLFEASLVHRMRGAASAAKGIDTDATGKVAGADARAKDFQARPASDEKYRGELAAREHADNERATVQNKLLGLEDVYKLYREYRTTPLEAQPPDAREQLEKQLARYGFASIDDFAAYVERFEKAFEEGAVRITLDILARYAGKLYKESQRYQDPAVVKDLHAKLGGFRTQFQARSPDQGPLEGLSDLRRG
ncbi:MAG TPA: hypothetical protein VFT22_01615 [Kofleriaceae bacterium]|nr:hypothetical protein [Kofleriaceae bacterium]